MAEMFNNQMINCAGKRDKSVAESFAQIAVGVYVFAMMIIFPLFYQDKFYNMGSAKYTFFKYVNLIVLPCVMLLSIVCLILAMRTMQFKELVRKISVTDWFVIGYFLVVVISYLLSPYRESAWWGSDGWNMGLFSQLVFIGIYFTVSRFFEVKKTHIYMFCIISGIVFFLGVINRFGIDPLNMHDGQGIAPSFLSTLGQPTWYSSFLCTVFPIGLYMFWNSDDIKESIAFGIYMFIGFSTMVTQNSDSAYIAMVLMMLGLFCFSFSSNKKLIRFVEICVIALTAFKFMGLLQILFADRVFELDTLSRMMSQSSLTLILWLAAIILLAVMLVLNNKGKLNVKRFKKVPSIVCAILICLFVLFLILIVCVTTGNIPESLNSLRDNSYLNFNDGWGNMRGTNWKHAIKLIGKSSFLGRLFGCGPDCYEQFLYQNYKAEMDIFWGANARLSNAHNEWLNTLVTLGLFGFITYVGIFISKIVTCVKNAAKEPLLVAVVLCILGYMGHNVFCYQQIICTPTVFIIMGIGEYIIRETKASDY